MTKLCIDCKWCTASNADQASERSPLCMKGARSPVDGEYIDRCDSQRDMYGSTSPVQSLDICGTDGDWWEARAKASAATP